MFVRVNFKLIFSKIDPSGRILVLGFSDGVIRIVVVDLEKTDATNPVRLIQAIKPHRSDVNRISINNEKTLLISGSMDHTIFVFKIQKDLPNITVEPIGYIPTPSSVTAVSWKSQSVKYLEFDFYDTVYPKHLELPSTRFFSTEESLKILFLVA